jgi:tight adherence protein B
MMLAAATAVLGHDPFTPALAVTAALMAGAAVLLRWPPSSSSRRPRTERPDRRASTGARTDRRSSGDDGPALSVPVLMELVAAGLDAGLPAPSALQAAVRAAGGRTRSQLQPVVNLWCLGAPVERAWRDAATSWQPLSRCLVLSQRTGASAATVLRAAARDLRSARRRRARVAANRLGVRLVVPLGLATLPAFVLWAVAPVALGLAEQALTGA